MELLANDDTGVLEQIAHEVVDYDERDGSPILESYALRFDHPPRPGTEAHRASIEPYVLALLGAFATIEDINF